MCLSSIRKFSTSLEWHTFILKFIEFYKEIISYLRRWKIRWTLTEMPGVPCLKGTAAFTVGREWGKFWEHVCWIIVPKVCHCLHDSSWFHWLKRWEREGDSLSPRKNVWVSKVTIRSGSVSEARRDVFLHIGHYNEPVQSISYSSNLFL